MIGGVRVIIVERIVAMVIVGMEVMMWISIILFIIYSWSNAHPWYRIRGGDYEEALSD